MADFEETLLIIDEDAKFSRHIKEHFDSQGFYVQVFSSINGYSIDQAKVSPDIIIADIDSDSLRTLTLSIKVFSPQPPIIVISRHADSETILQALRAGADDFLDKGQLDILALDQSVHRHLIGVRLQRENQAIRHRLEVTNKELRAGLEELRADQKAGRHVQMKMLPDRNICVAATEFDYCLKPSLYLSGDFFDYFRLSETKAAFYFADVSGHGASSAFVTVLLKNLTNRLQRNLRRKSSDDILHPDQFLDRVNKELMATDLGKHLTMFVGLMDFQERTLTYSIGAQFPMPILTNNGKTQYLEGRGQPVGLFDSPTFPLYEERLEAGFSLILCSDGLLEVINAKSLAEKEAILIETVKGARHTIEGLERAFALDQISELPDDIAILLIKESTVSDSRV